MCRFRRAWDPGDLHHVVSRFAGRAFRLTDDALRADYLRRLGTALHGSDWFPLGFALMGSHTHLAVVAGEAPPSTWMRPLNTGVAATLNRSQERIGPVFAGRSKTIGIAPEHAARLLAYLDNNPVRAGVVGDPADSDWTSHRALIGDTAAPPWLDVAKSLSLCGFDASPSGRLAYHDYVRSRSNDGRDSELSGDDMRITRAALRSVSGAPVEITMPRPPGNATSVARHDVLLPAHAPLHPRWPGDLRLLLAGVAAMTGLTVAQIQSRERTRPRVEARRLFVHAGRRLGRPLVELGAAVSVSAEAATYLLRRNPQAAAALDLQVADLVQACWRGLEGTILEGTILKNQVPDDR